MVKEQIVMTQGEYISFKEEYRKEIEKEILNENNLTPLSEYLLFLGLCVGMFYCLFKLIFLSSSIWINFMSSLAILGVLLVFGIISRTFFNRLSNK